VVSRRAREREASAAGRFDRGARGEERRLERRLGADRVGVEEAARRADLPDEAVRVAAEDVLLGRRRAFDEAEALVQGGDSLLRLWMAPGRVEVRERVVTYELDAL
jgi:hypothetical protein